jgi:hypothetical protein
MIRKEKHRMSPSTNSMINPPYIPSPMKEPIRYNFEPAELNKSAGAYVRKNGYFVRWEDYSALKSDAQVVLKHLDEACVDNASLRSEIERLRFEVEVHRKGWDSNDAYEYYCKLECEKMKREKDYKPLAGKDGWWGVINPPNEGDIKS